MPPAKASPQVAATPVGEALRRLSSSLAKREVLVGTAVFGAVLAIAATIAILTTSSTLRAFSIVFGLGAGGACAVLAALMAHLTRKPDAHYEPIQGEGGAWGMMEYEERR